MNKPPENTEVREIFVRVNGEFINITDLSRVAYENFLDAMLRLTSKYIQAVRNGRNDYDQ
jgi:hypothetical protein